MQTQKLQLNEIISVIPRLFRLTIISTIFAFISHEYRRGQIKAGKP